MCVKARCCVPGLVCCILVRSSCPRRRCIKHGWDPAVGSQVPSARTAAVVETRCMPGGVRRRNPIGHGGRFSSVWAGRDKLSSGSQHSAAADQRGGVFVARRSAATVLLGVDATKPGRFFRRLIPRLIGLVTIGRCLGRCPVVPHSHPAIAVRITPCGLHGLAAQCAAGLRPLLFHAQARCARSQRRRVSSLPKCLPRHSRSVSRTAHTHHAAARPCPRAPRPCSRPLHPCSSVPRRGPSQHGDGTTARKNSKEHAGPMLIDARRGGQ